MSTVSRAPSTTDEPPANLVLDFPGADITLRSQESSKESSLFRVPKIYIINCSSILGKRIRKAVNLPRVANAETSLPVVQLPESGEILHSLLTFILPVTPRVLPTPEKIMELLSVAQKYQMETVLTHIRGSISLQNSLPTHLDAALRIYALAQEYGLRPEALQTARAIFLKQSMTIEDLDSKLDAMPGTSLYELWKYHERVRVILASDLMEFRTSCARGTVTGLRCAQFSSSQIPSWLDYYIESVGNALNRFDLVEFDSSKAHHINARMDGCECVFIPSQTIHNFWEALTSVVQGSFEKAESALSLVREQDVIPAQINSATSPFDPFDMPDANLIIRSSDLVDFRVHKPILAIASPFFKDLLSLPQPSDSEAVDGIPVIRMAENSELLNSLISILYPVHTVIPNSYEKVLYLLAACRKYDMDSVQSFIRAEVNRGEFPAPKGVETCLAYAIASVKGLIPEMEYAARQTLDHPMTFDNLGEGLRLFRGWALRGLVFFRKQCRDDFITCLDLYIGVEPSGPSSIWVGCPEVMPPMRPGQIYYTLRRALPTWLNQVLSRNLDDLRVKKFTHSLDIHSRIREEYTTALQSHANCSFCLGVHIKEGLKFCTELENKLAHARDEKLSGRWCLKVKKT